ncbi:hypothetical protein SERLADRAFT_366311 [Serpula lacrymans var. lacrymans S7.9]|uniref:Uncharacterized protein n=1 Tax=Serpula lacrymans var. lacrymans (strain S7.9) TaxID=578457 RepID=F8NLI3_SERL9|nr:uncharacterized protein SERLADRAFT_366311 [Serpula lacrymans var. lacrymans S7.9]EGO28600.1 hypothetical protein SERLADRAFT_366311 [Serpula lacrymans var. lacrymans S7.9]
MPQVRLRPLYPHLKHDLSSEPGRQRGEKCSKYYSQYGEKRLTGGIMCMWCTHSICYVFHCIPQGEGRNDVFSAILTHWPKAPKVVPDFFANTLFVVDGFHAKGHTKCSPGAFLTTYSHTNPQLGQINSSAAECGNSALKHIRKLVSYMLQDHAIVYTKVFFSIWNCLEICRTSGVD